MDAGFLTLFGESGAFPTHPFASWHGPSSFYAQGELQAFLGAYVAKDAAEPLHTWPYSRFEHAGQPSRRYFCAACERGNAGGGKHIFP
jgi:hypothetical protein